MNTPTPKPSTAILASAATLKALIDQRQFSYEMLARRAGCSKRFISHLVAGRKDACTTSLAKAIAEALAVPTAVLFVDSTSAVAGRSVRMHASKTVA